MIYRRGLLRLLMGGATIWVAPSAFAQQTDNEINSIIKGLAPIAGQTKASDVPSAERVPVIIEHQTIYIDRRRRVELEIYFDFNSEVITDRAANQLTALGRALASSDLQPFRYLIAGHTDAVGSDEYNMDLSKRRARAVYNYLIENFVIMPNRLMVVGFGFRNLKDTQNPKAAINRRTEIVLIVS